MHASPHISLPQKCMYHDDCIYSRLAIYLLGRPLRKLRESFIESLPPDEADKEFSPCILKVMSAVKKLYRENLVV